MGPRKLTCANGARHSVSKVPRATEIRGFQSWSAVTLSTVTSYTNPPESGDHAMVTRGISASRSREAVFNTNELLENILLQLSIEDILTARQVNQHWNMLIVRSPRIKQTLFIRQAPRYRFWTFDPRTTLLHQFAAGDIKRFGEAWAHRQHIALPSRINPILLKENGPGIKGSLVHRAKYCESMYFKATPNLKNEESIIHEMFLALPAPREVEFKIFYHRRKPKGKGRFYGDGYMRGKVSNIYGVTLGDVLEKFLKEARIRAINEDAREFVICQESSVIWMMGHIFPTDEEFAAVKAMSL